MTEPGGNGRRRGSLYRWHRRAGVSAALVLVYLLATGLPLQFSGAFDLGQRHVNADVVLDWYGLEAPGDSRTSAGLVSVGEGLFADGQRIATLDGFRGALGDQGLLLAAGSGEVLLLEPDTWRTVDRFRLDARINRIGRWNGRVVLDTSSGVLGTDPDLLSWTPLSVPGGANVDWVALQVPDTGEADAYRRQFRGQMLTVERLLQDLHSGRAFGTIGIIVVDAATALLLFLSVSGLVMWWRSLSGRTP